jgi:glycosyltransferase involved in cell wall biosynthesis
LPDPRIGAGAPRALAILRALQRDCGSLTLLTTMWDPKGDGDVRRLMPGMEVVAGIRHAADLARFLMQHQARFDLIIVSRPHNMATLRSATAGQRLAVPVVYDAEALFAERESLHNELLGANVSPEHAAAEIKKEIALASNAQIITAVSSRTAEQFKAAGHSDVRVLGYGVSPQPTAPLFAHREGFLFVGPTYAADTPNTDSVVWFIDRVLPDIRRALGRGASFTFAGEQQAAIVKERLGNGVRSLGPVLDLAGAYAAARVFVAPTRFATGIPLKVYDAAAYGVPVVLTPLLAGQIGWTHEREALVASTPRDFAEQCVRLHNDPDLWQSLRAQALRRVESDCDPGRFDQVVAGMIETLRPR